MGHRFNPEHLERLDNPERRKALPPEEILRLLEVDLRTTMADIGCGPGYFTIPLARMTEEEVYALDVSPEMLDALSERASEAGLDNIKGVLSNAERIELPDNSVDGLLCSLMLHEVDDLPRTMQEFQRILRPGGKMLLIEWEKQPMDMGPPVEIRISSDELLEHVQALGMHGQVTKPNPDQYVVLANS